MRPGVYMRHVIYYNYTDNLTVIYAVLTIPNIGYCS